MAALSRAWYSAGASPRLWGSKGTYTRVAYDHLPRLDSARHDGSFAWLEEAREVYGLQYGLDDEDAPDDDVIAGKLAAITKLARREKLDVPRSFTHLLSRRELYGRIPSCTACYLELPDQLAVLPGQPGRFLRFMNDQQCCFVWGLHLVPGVAPTVVIAVPAFGEADGDTLEAVATFTEPEICASDFEEFIHRFWLENTLWFALQEGRPLSTEEAAYVAAAQEARLRT